MRELLAPIPSYANNSNDIVAMIKLFDIVENSIFLLAADAEASHPNANTEEIIALLALSLDTIIFKVGHMWSRK